MSLKSSVIIRYTTVSLTKYVKAFFRTTRREQFTRRSPTASRLELRQTDLEYRRGDGRRRGVANCRLAFDLRSQAIPRSSSLGPSAVATSDSRSVCLSSSLNPDIGSRIVSFAAVWCTLVDESYQIMP